MRTHTQRRSWLQDALKRKLVDFAWNRRFFRFFSMYPARARLFRVNPANSFNQPDSFFRSACFDQSSGQPRVNPGKQKGGGAKKIKISASFLFEVSCSQLRIYWTISAAPHSTGLLRLTLGLTLTHWRWRDRKGLTVWSTLA